MPLARSSTTQPHLTDTCERDSVWITESFRQQKKQYGQPHLRRAQPAQIAGRRLQLLRAERSQHPGRQRRIQQPRRPRGETTREEMRLSGQDFSLRWRCSCAKRRSNAPQIRINALSLWGCRSRLGPPTARSPAPPRRRRHRRVVGGALHCFDRRASHTTHAHTPPPPKPTPLPLPPPYSNKVLVSNVASK